MDRWPLNDTGDPTAGLTDDGRLLWDQSLDSLPLQPNTASPMPNLAGAFALESMPQNQTQRQRQINGFAQGKNGALRKQMLNNVSSEQKVQPSSSSKPQQQTANYISRPQLHFHVKQQSSNVPNSMKPRLDIVGIKRLCIAILRKMNISATIAELPDIDLNAGSDIDSRLVLPPKAMQFITAMILGTSGDKDVSLTEGSQISNGDLVAIQRIVTLVMRSKGVTFNSVAPQDAIVAASPTMLPLPQTNPPAAMINLLNITFALPACTTRLFLRLYRFILCILLASPHSDPFVRPHPVSAPIHDHHHQVTQGTRTIDLSTIEMKIWDGVYTTFSKFESDILLIKHNAQALHENQNDIPQHAEQLFALFRKIVTCLKWQAIMPQMASKDFLFKPAQLLPEELPLPGITSSTPIYFVPVMPSNHQTHPSHPAYEYHVKNSAIFDLVTRMKSSPSKSCGPLPRLYISKNLKSLVDEVSSTTLLAVFHSTKIDLVRNNTHNVTTDILVLLTPGPSAIYGTDADGNVCDAQDATKGFLFARPVCIVEKATFAINDRVKELCFNDLYSVVKVDALCRLSASQDAVTRRIILNIRSMVSNYVAHAFHAAASATTTKENTSKENGSQPVNNSYQTPANNGILEVMHTAPKDHTVSTVATRPGIKMENGAATTNNNDAAIPMNAINLLLKGTASGQNNQTQMVPTMSFTEPAQAPPPPTNNVAKIMDNNSLMTQSSLVSGDRTNTHVNREYPVSPQQSTPSVSSQVTSSSDNLKRPTSTREDNDVAAAESVKKTKTKHTSLASKRPSPEPETVLLGSPNKKHKAIQEATPDSPPNSKPIIVPEDTLPPVTENSGKEIDHDVWRRLFKACRLKGVAVRNIQEKYADLNWAAPDSEGFFKQVYFLNDVVIQLFRQMTMYQRVTEVACLMKLRNLPHMAQLVEVLYNDNGDVVGLSVERYQTTLKQFAHAHSHHRLTAYQKRSIIEQMLVCMKSIHEAGLAHRDLSEVNFMVNALDRTLPDGSQDVQLYLIDFGKSLFCNAKDMREWFVDVKRDAGEYQGDVVPETREELEEWCQTLPWVKGKPDHGYRMYRSIQTLPKARKDDKILPWLIHPQAEDMYSIAVMIWKIFAETEPWQGILDTDLQGLRFVVQDDYRIQKAVEREVHGPVSQEFVLKCLKTRPQDRATAAQMLEWFLQEDIKASLLQEWKTYSSTTRSSRSHRRR